MANEPVGKVNLRDLSPRDKGMAGVEGRRGTKVSLKARAPLSLVELAGSIPQRRDIREGENLYKKFAYEPLYGFIVERNELGKSEGEEEFVIVGPRVTAEGVNALLYFAASYKGFGFDTDDIINDWTALYSGTTENERLRTAHSTMPGWGIFEQSRSLILDVLKRDYPNPYSYFLNTHPDDVIIPTIHGKKDGNGNITLSVEPLDDELRELIVEELPHQVANPSRLDAGMGAVFVAAYSEDNARYPKESGYAASNTRTQVIGPTQVLAFVIRRLAERQARPNLVPNQDIQQSKLLLNYVDYLVTNNRPDHSGAVQPLMPGIIL